MAFSLKVRSIGAQFSWICTCF